LDEPQAVSQLSIKLMQVDICLIYPDFRHQDHQAEVFRCEFHRADLND
jgi:hypothetical protein